MTEIRKKQISVGVKCLTVLASLSGILLSFFGAAKDGYSHWAYRLMYFTAQSNLWLVGIFLVLLLRPFLKGMTGEKWDRTLYLLKYVFTVSITVTALVFCFLLAPFADASYRAWSLASILYHVVAPALAVLDFFLDSGDAVLKRRDTLFALVPPLVYLIFAAVLHYLNVDFGRGDTYPYFFLNFSSPAGFFGAMLEPEPMLGSFYWIMLFCGIVFGLAFFYLGLHPATVRERRRRRKAK